MSAEIEKQLITMLAAVWRRVDWKTTQRGKYGKADIFASHIQIASHEANVGAAMNTLCERLSVATPARPTDIHDYMAAYEYCRTRGNDVLDVMSEQYKHLAVMTYGYVYDAERVDDTSDADNAGKADDSHKTGGSKSKKGSKAKNKTEGKP